MTTGPFFSGLPLGGKIGNLVPVEMDCLLEHGCECFITTGLDNKVVALSEETEHQ